jgi:SAM-dependent methyltransferase
MAQGPLSTPQKIADLLPTPDPGALDYSMLTHNDLINIVLQRSEVLRGERQPAAIIKAWEAGDTGPLDRIVETQGAALAQRAVQTIRTEFEGLVPVLDKIRPKRIADIGCGYAFFDLFLHHRYGCDLLLIDVEENEHRHFGFQQEGAAYTNLQTGRAFLVANGVSDSQISTWNPEKEDPDDTEHVDLAFSFLSCGFHYPVDMYMPFFRFGVVPGGSIILDIRGLQFQDEKRTLNRLGSLKILTQGKGRKRVWIKRGATA